MKKILLPVDFTAATHAAAEAAIDQALAFGAEIVVLHVAEPDPDFVGYDPGPQYVRDTVADELRSERKELVYLRERMEARGVVVKSRIIQGATVEKILAEAERSQADLIVLAHHPAGLLQRLWRGSVSEELLRQAPCPLLIIPGPRAGRT